MRNNIRVLDEKDSKILVYNSRSNKTYTLGKPEFAILQMFDKGKSMKEIQEVYSQYTDKQLKDLYAFFDLKQFFSGTKGHMQDLSQLYKNPFLKSLVHILANEILYFSIPLFVIGLIVQLKEFHYDDIVELFCWIKSNQVLTMIITIAIMCISLLFHEIAHAIVAIYYGAIVLKMGVTINHCIPRGYTKLAWRTIEPNKKIKLRLYCAGILIHLQIAGIASVLIRCINKQYVIYILLFGIVNLILVSSNFLIFGNSDGSLVLFELLSDDDKKSIKKMREKDIVVNISQNRKFNISKENIMVGIYLAILIGIAIWGIKK